MISKWVTTKYCKKKISANADKTKCAGALLILGLVY